MWPYIIRELPLSPVEALRMTLREKKAGEVATKIESELRKGVEYFPAHLANDTEMMREEKLQQERGPRAHSDLNGLRARLAEVQRRQQHLLGKTSSGPALERRRDRHTVDTRLRAKSTDVSLDQNDPLLCRRRSASNGAGRLKSCNVEETMGLVHRGDGDRTDCPLGCGEEVRVHDLGYHQTSLCALRYITCFMPGCGVLVTASKMGIHLKHECIEAKNRRVLADKGKSAEGETACNACGASMPRNCLRKHLAHNCDMRLVSCSRPGCNVSVTAKSLADHQRIDCTAARRNAAFVEEAARKPKMENCPDCQTTIVSNLFRAHLAEECSRRIVICPNKKLGCDKDMHASEVESHVREDCVVQLDRDERASHHDSRLGRVRCSGCGYTVVVRHLANHQQHKCPNRRVPCKHWELGCRAMLRLSTMDEHTKVDRLLEPRACLAFDGGKAYIALGEEDIKPPWTVEMWIWRPGLVEGTREKTRTALKAYWGFQRARDRLAVAERRLAMLEPLLVAAATSSAKIPSKESKEEREKLTDEMVDAATVRDDAKLELVVSSVVLNKNLAAAIRGVEEITAQDRLCNFDRLALGSTPWYAIPTDAVSNIIENARGGHRDLTKCGRSKKALTNLQRSPPSNPLDPQGSSNRTVKMPNSDAKSATGETSIGISEGADAGPRGFKANAGTSQAHHDYFHVRESNESDKRTHDVGQAAKVGHDVSPKDVVATIRTGESLQVDGIPAGVREENMEEVRGKDEAPTVAEVVNFPAAPQEAVEISLAQREASYWAEWVALNGTSLARKILYLASETLPRLKVEIVNITGLAVEVLFGDSSDAASDVVGTTPVGDDSSSRSNQRSGKSAARKAARKARRKEKHEQQFGKKLETRMAEEVRKRAGVESLFGSDKVLFQLEMGPQDRVGIKLAGKPDKIFNYRCPRERWVHLSFVSDSSGVLLLENGKTASRLPDVSVPLPMREIGGRDMACQCLLQEVRYWRVKRSKEELTAWMHEVLPSTSVANGLVAYWTFEEGAGEHVNDVTQQRFRAMRVGRGLEWVTPALMCLCKVGEAPTPSWREQNVCKVELRRARLVQRGRLHQQYVSCPAGCGETFLRKNARAHTAYRCKMRMVTCSMATCGKSVMVRDLTRHLHEDCAAHAAWLRMAEAGEENQETCPCPHCSEMIRGCNLKLHIKYVCQWARDSCRNPGCGALIPRVRLVEHEQRFCGASSAVHRRRRLARARARSSYARDWAQDGV